MRRRGMESAARGFATERVSRVDSSMRRQWRDRQTNVSFARTDAAPRFQIDSRKRTAPPHGVAYAQGEDVREGAQAEAFASGSARLRQKIEQMNLPG
jgi:hypothetical protein